MLSYYKMSHNFVHMLFAGSKNISQNNKLNKGNFGTKRCLLYRKKINISFEIDESGEKI